MMMSETVEELRDKLNKASFCQRCNCLGCDREGFGENHDHVCTGAEGCIETHDKLVRANRVLRHLCGLAALALAVPNSSTKPSS